MNRRPLVASGLLATAVWAGLALWQLRRQPTPSGASTVRSDYVLKNYELVALDTEGNEAFTVKGPYLQRDPGGKSLSLRTPRFSFPDRDGGHWTMSSDLAWVAEKGEEVRLIDDVLMIGPAMPSGDRTRFGTESLQVFPKLDQARTDDAVTITRAGSILRGRGMRADLAAHRFQLLADVKGRYAPRRR